MLLLLLPLLQVAAPVPPADVALRAEVLIERLQGEEFASRCRAHRELQAMVLWIEPLLRENFTHRDAEVAWRCRDIVATFVNRPKPRIVPAGKIALCDAKLNRIAIDIRDRDGVQPGACFEATRLGKRIGFLIVVEVRNWGSWAEPDGGMPAGNFLNGDLVTPIERR